MPKDTFYNLNEDKKDKIIEVLKETFKNKTIFDANVKEIVEKLNIARGSFYQYFENLEDAYFMILELETVDIHKLFIKILKENSLDLFKSLEIYGKELSNILFLPDNYSIYKNRFLYWTPELDKSLKNYKLKKDNENFIELSKKDKDFIKTDQMQFIKAVIHNLIQRNYLENWTKEVFLSNFNRYLEWLKGGIKYDGIN